MNTYYGIDQLVASPSARTFAAALLIGLLFGFALERAGFGSSRKLAGIFYFRDMTVLRVMFTALITGMLGLSLVAALGWIDLENQVYLLPTIYGAQIVGGLIFGVGFVLSGWCPGTGAVGVASGKLDALVFLGGVVLGAIAFNETYSWTAGLRTEGQALVAFGIPRGLFALGFTLVAVAAFYFAEWIEGKVGGGGRYLNSSFLRTMSVAMVVVAAAVFLLPTPSGETALAAAGAPASEQALLETIEVGGDHIEPEELADLLVAGGKGLVVVDVRSPGEYAAFHIPGSVNVQLPGLPEYLAPYKNRGRIVLYSNGMTHPAQARDVLARLGYQNVSMLTDGLRGFLDRCLKPVSLRREPLSEAMAQRVRLWRSAFLAPQGLAVAAAPAATGQEAKALVSVAEAGKSLGLVDPAWLAKNLGSPDLKIIDVRKQPEYNTSHIPGSLSLNPESVRGVVGGVPSVLLPANMLAEQFGLMGLTPSDKVVIVPGDVRDATLVGMALDRVGQDQWGILDGGFDRWVAEKRPVDAALPAAPATTFAARQGADDFTVGYKTVLEDFEKKKAMILDTRPAAYFSGEKSEEARAGHIPGAVNRPFSEDLGEGGNFKPIAELATAYEQLIPGKDSPIVVHCRTGHQASQTYFVLRHLLGYKNVKWYDGSWTEWAARPELPVAK